MRISKRKIKKPILLIVTILMAGMIACLAKATYENSRLGARVDSIQNQIAKRQRMFDSEISARDRKLTKLQKDYDEQSRQCAALENTIKFYASLGVMPANYTVPAYISRGSYSKYKGRMVYVGNWLGTYYAPTKDECGNNRGLTKSGKAVTPGCTIAVDTEYWPLGTHFYIKGIGEVIAEDIGSGIKGRERFDLAVFSSKISHSGSFKADVYIIK